MKKKSPFNEADVSGKKLLVFVLVLVRESNFICSFFKALD